MKITSIAYPGNDTAADPAGGQTITITGSGFASGLSVYVDGSIVGTSTYVNSTTATFTSPTKTAGSYALVLVNADGGSATYITGIQYSGTPNWLTSAGTLATVYEYGSVSSTVSANGDAPITYAVSSGSLPSGLSLGSSNGVISGTTASVASGSSTEYFTLTASDAQNQDTARNFNIVINADVVSWSSPADSTTYTTVSGSALSTVNLSATSAAGKSITYTANSLPTGLSLSGSSITGTPTVSGNSSSIITATAATTGKTATRTLNWVVQAPATAEILLVAGGGAGGAKREGGGGAGGLLYYGSLTPANKTANGPAISLSNGTSYSIGIGSGGPWGSSGSNSTFSGGGVSYTAIGGGYVGQSGGSGGGGGASGTSGQGNAGSTGSGYDAGGGAGGAGRPGMGTEGAWGGVGVEFSVFAVLSGSNGGRPNGTVSGGWFAGGGGGGGHGTGGGSGGHGGIGGGGAGGYGGYSNASGGSGSLGNDAVVNSGGGGGGTSDLHPRDGGSHGGTGGSGICIVSYQGSTAKGTGGSISTTLRSGWVCHTFTGTGTFTYTG
jgi:hypothetical protein